MDFSGSQLAERVRVTKVSNPNVSIGLTRGGLIRERRIWQYGSQSERPAMRIASSPTLRIAAGLLFAALLSVVGYQVFRRWISHGPEALLERADVSLWRNRFTPTLCKPI